MLASAAASYTRFLLPCISLLASAIEINAIALQCQKRAAHMITRVLSFLMMMFSPHGGFFLYVLLKRHSKLLLATNIIPDRSTFVGTIEPKVLCQKQIKKTFVSPSCF